MPKTEVCVVYSEPNIISVGRRFGELDPYRVAVGQADVGAGGRSTRLRGRRGVLRVYADRVTGRVFGGAAIGPHGEQLARLLGWAAENGLSVADALAMPGANPVAGEVFAAAMRELAGKVKGGTLPMPGLGRVPVDPPRDLRPF
jgi:dihydrolipoamide dehydrogenase